MHARVLLLRRGGVKLSPMPAGPWLDGQLEMRKDTGRRLVLRHSHGPPDAIMAALHQPAIVQVIPGRMIVRGIEQSGDAAVVQEWLIEPQPYIGDNPARPLPIVQHVAAD